MNSTASTSVRLYIIKPRIRTIMGGIILRMSVRFRDIIKILQKRSQTAGPAGQKNLVVNRPELVELVGTGIDVARYHIAHPIRYPTEPDGSIQQAAGDLVFKWKLLDSKAAKARDSDQTEYAKICDDISGEDSCCNQNVSL